MKKYALLLVMLSSQLMVSQIADPLLYDKDWYINYIQIDGQLFTLPEGLEPEESLMVFAENSSHFTATICSTIEADIERVINESSFGFINMTIDNQTCDEPLNSDFDSLHFNFYVDNASEVLDYSYYVIEPFGTPFVEIRAPNGDVVEYFSDSVMNVGEFETTKINLFPNPFTETLQVDSPYHGNFDYKIFTLSGQLVKEGTLSTSESLNVSNLSNGMYLTKLTNTEGEERSFKIVKE
ncbi:T9SS type A sorting domain-containing protein [Rasiella rasia]|uniref:T9SS type A sorting domain-containing protein n=1 Tax=Rasiella rasia TaxID=2744027 RepID=A0A6G6GLJ0_9FLAO|nr:T9SS type A sorting domain-containing protein [Rasiella rasia]QIE59456.1 T9SS type A sorting domain-containing protein [Rasiella rasia]